MPFLYTASEYTDMVLIYGACDGNAAIAIRKYRERYGASRVCPTNPRTIVHAVQRMRENQPLVPHQEGVPTRQVAVSRERQIYNHFIREPTCSLRRAALRFGVHNKTIHRILKRNKCKPYKYRKVQALLARDKPVRVAYCQWLLNKISNNSNFLYDFMWTDESTFTRNGLWNRQNLRYWSIENPHLVQESAHQYRFAVNVWAAIHRNSVIGPIFIDGQLNSAKFLEILEGPVTEYVDTLPLNAYRRVWYQLDGAPAHSVLSARERLSAMFGEQWIGRYGPTRWPARSPDLTPLDFFLWGFIKSEVYSTDVNSVEELKSRIITAFDKLRDLAANTNILYKVRCNMIRRCNLCIHNNGGHFENLKI